MALCLSALLGSGASLLVHRRSSASPIVISTPSGVPPAGVPAAADQAAAGASPSTADPTDPRPPGTSATAAPPALETLAVHVAGAVRHPALYSLPPGSRVANAIHAAGGPSRSADLDSLNLAEKVQDGEKVYVPSKSERDDPAVANNPENKPGNAIGHVIKPPAPALPMPVEIAHALPSQSGDTIAHALPSHSGNKIAEGSSEQIDLNTATEEDLQRLPGVGPAMAGRIIAYRGQLGRFSSIDDLHGVKGIGDKRFSRISPHVMVR